jgi:hypothetical protein
MTPEWLAIQSFQRNQDLLNAINTLSIRTKLGSGGHTDEDRTETAQARETLASFLKNLAQVVDQAEQTESGPLLGVDPRLRQLAGDFSRARQGARFRSRLFQEPLSDTVDSLTSTEPTDRQALVESLSELRTLIEEHVQTDVVQILEDF